MIENSSEIGSIMWAWKFNDSGQWFLSLHAQIKHFLFFHHCYSIHFRLYNISVYLHYENEPFNFAFK
jgi:hypothetical protein